MNNNYSSPDLYGDLMEEKINCCGTVRPNRKEMPGDFRSKTLKQKWSDIGFRVSGDMTAVVWKEKRDVHTLTNIRDPPEEGNFCVDRNALKPAIVEDYNGHVGYVDESERMGNSYCISRCMWKWMEKLFFHLIYLKILKSQILLKFHGSKPSHRLKACEEYCRACWTTAVSTANCR
jgi:hypothetical protein